MRLHHRYLLAAAGIAALAMTAPARADILIDIDKSTQKMTVTVDGTQRYAWPVSTGGRGYDTPSGEFKPFRMEKDHFSREWDDAPMPNSIFFTQEGHAIHGTFETRNIGHPVSHGCVRLSRANAATLFELVKQEGMGKTRVVLEGHIPPGTAAPPALARRRSQDLDALDDDPSIQGYRGIEGDSRYTRGYYENAPSYDSIDPRGYGAPRRGYYRPAPFPFRLGW